LRHTWKRKRKSSPSRGEAT